MTQDPFECQKALHGRCTEFPLRILPSGFRQGALWRGTRRGRTRVGWTIPGRPRGQSASRLPHPKRRSRNPRTRPARCGTAGGAPMRKARSLAQGKPTLGCNLQQCRSPRAVSQEEVQVQLQARAPGSGGQARAPLGEAGRQRCCHPWCASGPPASHGRARSQGHPAGAPGARGRRRAAPAQRAAAGVGPVHWQPTPVPARSRRSRSGSRVVGGGRRRRHKEWRRRRRRGRTKGGSTIIGAPTPPHSPPSAGGASAGPGMWGRATPPPGLRAAAAAAGGEVREDASPQGRPLPLHSQAEH